jgi:NAD(P)-dependent dehydrogenase (short-subunit alcohol dehydrogenase family)
MVSFPAFDQGTVAGYVDVGGARNRLQTRSGQEERVGVLDERVGIVTGAGQGIGRGISLALAREGMDLVLVDRDEHAAKAVADEVVDVGAKSLAVTGDVSEPELAAHTVERGLASFGRIDALVNSAQAMRVGVPFEQHTDADLDIALSTGLWGAFRFMRACFEPLAVRGGAIVNIVSSAGTHGLPGQAGYAAAKEGIRGLTKVAANEWGVHEIRVNALAPQAMSPTAAAFFADHPERLAAKLAQRPIKRDGDAELDIGRSVVFLVGPDSRFITGVTLMVNGGLTIMP